MPVTIPALKQTLHFNAYLFLKSPRARLFHHPNEGFMYTKRFFLVQGGIKGYHILKLHKIRSPYHTYIFYISSQEHSSEISVRPVRHFHATLLHCYSTCWKSPPFLEWHSSARFPASQRTSPQVSLLMPPTSLLMSRFSSAGSADHYSPLK